MRNRKIIFTIILAVDVVCSIVVMKFPTVKGLDLVGGTRLLLEAQTTDSIKEITPEIMDSLQFSIENRVNALGVSETTVQKAGDKRLIVEIPNISDPEKAKEFKGFEIHTIKDRNELKVGYYFYSDLLDCSIIDQSNNKLGIVIKVEEFPAQLTLRVKQENGKDFFVPFVKQFIQSVDVEKKEIHINVIEGMLWKLQF